MPPRLFPEIFQETWLGVFQNLGRKLLKRRGTCLLEEGILGVYRVYGLNFSNIWTPELFFGSK